MMDGFTEALLKDNYREQQNMSHLLALRDKEIEELKKRNAFLESTINYLHSEGIRRGRRN